MEHSVVATFGITRSNSSASRPAQWRWPSILSLPVGPKEKDKIYDPSRVRSRVLLLCLFKPHRYTVNVLCFRLAGFWDNELQFFVARRGLDDTNIYKCCKTPAGYYLDYTSCYYMPTHDQYWEYYVRNGSPEHWAQCYNYSSLTTTKSDEKTVCIS